VFLKSVKSGMLPQTGISFVSAASALCWLTHLAPMPSEQGIPKIRAPLPLHCAGIYFQGQFG
jgi:hypothetical protein